MMMNLSTSYTTNYHTDNYQLKDKKSFDQSRESQTLYSKDINSHSCDFCSGNHLARNCTLEKAMSKELKEFGGHMIETKIGQHIKCPMCITGTLSILDDNSPYKDAVCTCGRIFEIKSKALSVPKKSIPSNLAFYAGLYDEYVYRVNKEGLHMIFVIYSINRKNKTIEISSVYHASNRQLRDSKSRHVIVTKRKDNDLSYIEIPNKTNLKELPMPTILFSFNDMYEKLKDKYIV
jgi:hypothetical protein